MNDNTKTIVITGGTGGIGFQTALGLASQGHRIIVTGRDRARGEAAISELQRLSNNNDIHLAIADLSLQAEVSKLAKELMDTYPQIDVLINNAGSISQEPSTTADGVDREFAVNVVTPYMLIKALLPALKAAAPSRVINVTGGRSGAAFDMDRLLGKKTFISLLDYDATKRAMEAATLVQAKQLETEGVWITIVFPGAAATSMTQSLTIDGLTWYLKPFWPLFKMFFQRDDGGKTATKAARSSIWAATAPETLAESGVYYDTNVKRVKLDPSVHDPANQRYVLDRIAASID